MGNYCVIFQELLQNAEDAGAAMVQLLLDERRIHRDCGENVAKFTKFFQVLFSDIHILNAASFNSESVPVFIYRHTFTHFVTKREFERDFKEQHPLDCLLYIALEELCIVPLFFHPFKFCFRQLLLQNQCFDFNITS